MKTLVRYICACSMALVMFVPCSLLMAQTRNFYSTENGLSSSLINQLFQDSRGFIWVATEYGLDLLTGLIFPIIGMYPMIPFP